MVQVEAVVHVRLLVVVAHDQLQDPLRRGLGHDRMDVVRRGAGLLLEGQVAEHAFAHIAEVLAGLLEGSALRLLVQHGDGAGGGVQDLEAGEVRDGRRVEVHGDQCAVGVRVADQVVHAVGLVGHPAGPEHRMQGVGEHAILQPELHVLQQALHYEHMAEEALVVMDGACPSRWPHEHHHLQRVGGEHIAHVATLGGLHAAPAVQVQGGDIQAAHEAAEGIGGKQAAARCMDRVQQGVHGLSINVGERQRWATAGGLARSGG